MNTKALRLYLILFTAIMLSSCARTGWRYMEFVSWIDYAPLTERGLYVSPFESASDDYEFIGDLTIAIRSGYDDSAVVKETINTNEEIVDTDDLYSPLTLEKGDIVNIANKPHIDVTIESMLNKFGDIAISKGADAIFGIKYMKGNEYDLPIIELDGESLYTITGILARKKR